jgi:hypothetical protein
MVRLFPIHTKPGRMRTRKAGEIVSITDIRNRNTDTKNFLILSQAGTPTKTTNRMSPTLGGCSQDSFSDRQFIVICSEKQARVVALPSQNCVYRQQITESDFLVKAEVISMKGNVLDKVFLNVL